MIGRLTWISLGEEAKVCDVLGSLECQVEEFILLTGGSDFL